MLKQKCTQRKAETEEMGKAKYEKTEKKIQREKEWNESCTQTE